MKIFVDHETQRKRERQRDKGEERNGQKTKQTADLDITR